MLRLAPRLLVGVDPTRPAPRVRAAVTRWVDEAVTAARDEDHGGWAAESDGTVIGFVSVSTDHHWSGEVDACVGELMVDERFERQGIAASLLSEVERWATQRGLGRVRLSTGAANAGARAFYERVGYEVNEVTLTRCLQT